MISLAQRPAPRYVNVAERKRWMALARTPSGADTIKRFLAHAETAQELDRNAAFEALVLARFEAWRADVDGTGRDEARKALEALAKAERRLKVKALFEKLLTFAEKPSAGAMRPTWNLRPTSAIAANILASALLGDYPQLELILKERFGADGVEGLPLPRLVRRGRRGDPLGPVKKAAKERLLAAGLLPEWPTRLLAAVGIR